MTDITVVGAGAYGVRIAGKYKKFDHAHIKAVVSRRRPMSEEFFNVPFFDSAIEWKRCYGKPTETDVFDLCVHQDILLEILQQFVKIGARNFVLPKPIALSRGGLSKIVKLKSRYNLNLFVASQWHYSRLVEEVGVFVKKHKKDIASVEINFSRTFNGPRADLYTPVTAFLPHILQILFTTKLINERSEPVIENYSNKKLRVQYKGRIRITAESDLASKERIETIKIFLKKSAKPALVANLSGIMQNGSFVEYPSIIVFGKKHQVREEPLDILVENILSYFTRHSLNKGSAFDRYVAIADAMVRLIEKAHHSVVVIGGGIFGVTSALELARRGYSVLVLEKEPQIITGASMVNQCRVHMGYHYPRDKKTAKDSLLAGHDFKKKFDKAIVKDVQNYYLIAKEGSLTSPAEFVAFCDKMRLPYRRSWPATMDISREKVVLSLNVPEHIFDANLVREILNERISISPNVTLLTSAEVIGIKKQDEGFNIQYTKNGIIESMYSGAVINATYGNINHINRLLGLPIDTYQYELCEEFVVKTPWGRTGWAIMDGPFFGIMPFGFSKNHIFYDVELSVIERSVGELPQFKHDLAYYKDKKRTAERFERYKEKWKPWVPQIGRCRKVESMLVTRIVLPKKEKTDARPTVSRELLPGFWQVFSGKITTSVPQSIEIARSIDRFFKKK